MRRQPEGVPDAADRHAAQASGLGHPSQTPVGLAARGRLKRARHHPLDSAVVDRPGRAGPQLIVQAIEPLLDEAAGPLAHGLFAPSSLRATSLPAVFSLHRSTMRAPRARWGRVRVRCASDVNRLAPIRQNQGCLRPPRAHARSPCRSNERRQHERPTGWRSLVRGPRHRHIIGHTRTLGLRNPGSPDATAHISSLGARRPRPPGCEQGC
jgi:hypothetical protein